MISASERIHRTEIPHIDKALQNTKIPEHIIQTALGLSYTDNLAASFYDALDDLDTAETELEALSNPGTELYNRLAGENPDQFNQIEIQHKIKLERAQKIAQAYKKAFSLSLEENIEQINRLEVKLSFTNRLQQLERQKAAEVKKPLIKLHKDVCQWYIENAGIQQYLSGINDTKWQTSDNIFIEKFYLSKISQFLLLKRLSHALEQVLHPAIEHGQNNQRKKFFLQIANLAHAINTHLGIYYAASTSAQPNNSENRKKQDIEFGIKISMHHLLAKLDPRLFEQLRTVITQERFSNVFNSTYDASNHDTQDDGAEADGGIFGMILAALREHCDIHVRKKSFIQQVPEMLPSINRALRRVDSTRVFPEDEQHRNTEESGHSVCSSGTIGEEKLKQSYRDFIEIQADHYNTTYLRPDQFSPIQKLIVTEYHETQIHFDDEELEQLSSKAKQLIGKVYGFRTCVQDDREDQAVYLFSDLAALVRQVAEDYGLTRLINARSKGVHNDLVVLTLKALDHYTPERMPINAKQQLARSISLLNSNPLFLYYVHAEDYSDKLTNKGDPLARNRLSSANLVALAQDQLAVDMANIDEARQHKHQQRVKYLKSIRTLLESQEHQESGRFALSFFGGICNSPFASNGRAKFTKITQDIPEEFSIENERIVQQKAEQAFVLQLNKQQDYNPGMGLGVRTQETIKLYKQISELVYPDDQRNSEHEDDSITSGIMTTVSLDDDAPETIKPGEKPGAPESQGPTKQAKYKKLSQVVPINSSQDNFDRSSYEEQPATTNPQEQNRTPNTHAGLFDTLSPDRHVTQQTQHKLNNQGAFFKRAGNDTAKTRPTTPLPEDLGGLTNQAANNQLGPPPGTMEHSVSIW